jgi:hypothetical protein
VTTIRHRVRSWDAGPEVTARDLTALRWIAEQYTTRLDVAAVLLGRLSPVGARTPGRLGPRTLRQRLERWEQVGWTTRRRLLGHTWIVATTAGIRLTGLELEPWEPAAVRLADNHGHSRADHELAISTRPAWAHPPNSPDKDGSTLLGQVARQAVAKSLVRNQSRPRRNPTW